MAKNHLVIVESPSKAKTIGKYLGKDYVVKASMGHLRDLPKSKMGVDLENDFTPQQAVSAILFCRLRFISSMQKFLLSLSRR